MDCILTVNSSVSSSALKQPTAYRPRLLLAGTLGSGQSSHLAPALLHHLDKLPVHRLDLPTLYSVSAKTPEESCAQVTHTQTIELKKYRLLDQQKFEDKKSLISIYSSLF